MSEKQISCIPIEQEEAGEIKTVGFGFLNDLVYLIRTGDYHKLSLPALSLITELNFIEDTHDGSRLSREASQKHEEEKALLIGMGGQQLPEDDDESDEEDDDGKDEDDDDDPFFNFGGGSTPISQKARDESKSAGEKRLQRQGSSLYKKEHMMSREQQTSIETFFGKILGIERLHLFGESDTLREVIEKINLVPESKLVNIDKNRATSILSISDLLACLGGYW